MAQSAVTLTIVLEIFPPAYFGLFFLGI